MLATGYLGTDHGCCDVRATAADLIERPLDHGVRFRFGVGVQWLSSMHSFDGCTDQQNTKS